MASAELTRRVEKVVHYPPLSELAADQRREFHEALLDAEQLRGPAGQVAGGDPQGRAEPARPSGRQKRLSAEPVCIKDSAERDHPLSAVEEPYAERTDDGGARWGWRHERARVSPTAS